MIKEHLLELFKFNNQVNKDILLKIKTIADQSESVRLFSHLINCQIKWLARILDDAQSQKLDWWGPVYAVDELEEKWEESTKAWVDYLQAKNEQELCTEVSFAGMQGGHFAATPKDIALHLNYHSIHHRAQIQSLLCQQGVDSNFVDYIRTKFRKLE